MNCAKPHSLRCRLILQAVILAILVIFGCVHAAEPAFRLARLGSCTIAEPSPYVPRSQLTKAFDAFFYVPVEILLTWWPLLALCLALGSLLRAMPQEIVQPWIICLPGSSYLFTGTREEALHLATRAGGIVDQFVLPHMFQNRAFHQVRSSIKYIAFVLLLAVSPLFGFMTLIPAALLLFGSVAQWFYRWYLFAEFARQWPKLFLTPADEIVPPFIRSIIHTSCDLVICYQFMATRNVIGLTAHITNVLLRSKLADSIVIKLLAALEQLIPGQASRKTLGSDEPDEPGLPSVNLDGTARSHEDIRKQFPATSTAQFFMNTSDVQSAHHHVNPATFVFVASVLAAILAHSLNVALPLDTYRPSNIMIEMMKGVKDFKSFQETVMPLAHETLRSIGQFVTGSPVLITAKDHLQQALNEIRHPLICLRTKEIQHYNEADRSELKRIHQVLLSIQSQPGVLDQPTSIYVNTQLVWTERQQNLVSPVDFSSPRPEPIGVLMLAKEGAGGTGKTYFLARHLIPDFCRRVGLPCRKHQPALSNPKQNHDQYRNETVIECSEFMSTHTTQEMTLQIVETMKTMIDTTRTQLNMAAIEDKGRYFYNQALTTFTTNVTSFQVLYKKWNDAAGPAEADSVVRRLPFVLRLSKPRVGLIGSRPAAVEYDDLQMLVSNKWTSVTYDQVLDSMVTLWKRRSAAAPETDQPIYCSLTNSTWDPTPAQASFGPAPPLPPQKGNRTKWSASRIPSPQSDLGDRFVDAYARLSSADTRETHEVVVLHTDIPPAPKLKSTSKTFKPTSPQLSPPNPDGPLVTITTESPPLSPRVFSASQHMAPNLVASKFLSFAQRWGLSGKTPLTMETHTSPDVVRPKVTIAPKSIWDRLAFWHKRPDDLQFFDQLVERAVSEDLDFYPGAFFGAYRFDPPIATGLLPRHVMARVYDEWNTTWQKHSSAIVPNLETYQLLEFEANQVYAKILSVRAMRKIAGTALAVALAGIGLMGAAFVINHLRNSTKKLYDEIPVDHHQYRNDPRPPGHAPLPEIARRQPGKPAVFRPMGEAPVAAAPHIARTYVANEDPNLPSIIVKICNNMRDARFDHPTLPGGCYAIACDDMLLTVSHATQNITGMHLQGTTTGVSYGEFPAHELQVADFGSEEIVRLNEGIPLRFDMAVIKLPASQPKAANLKQHVCDDFDPAHAARYRYTKVLFNEGKPVLVTCNAIPSNTSIWTDADYNNKVGWVRTLVLDTPSTPGDCCAPVFVNSKAHAKKLIGFVVGGGTQTIVQLFPPHICDAWLGRTRGMSLNTKVTQAELDAGGRVVERSGRLHSVPKGIEFQGHVTPSVNLYSPSQLVPGPDCPWSCSKHHHAWQCKAHDCPNAPTSGRHPPLPFPVSYQGKPFDPIDASMERCKRTVPIYDFKGVPFKRLFLRALPPPLYEAQKLPATRTEGLNGYRFAGTQARLTQPLETRTSMGHPLGQERPAPVPGEYNHAKFPYLHCSVHGNKSHCPQDCLADLVAVGNFETRLSSAEQNAAQGLPYPVVYQRFPKDETREFGPKFEDCKPIRDVLGSPADHSALCREYFGPLLSGIQFHWMRPEMPIKIGINPHSVECSLLFEALYRELDTVVQGDRGKSDKTLRRIIADATFAGLCEYAKHHYPESYDQWLIGATVVWDNIIYPVWVTGDALYQGFSDFPTGLAITAELNSLCFLMERYFLTWMYAASKGVEFDEDKFFDWFLHGQYGDDFFMGAKRHCPPALADIQLSDLAELGAKLLHIELTLPSKTAVSQSVFKFSDLEFLSRELVIKNGRIHFALNVAAIKRTTEYCRDASLPGLEQLFRSALTEWFHRLTPQEYEAQRMKVQGYLQERGYHPTFPSHNELALAYLSSTIQAPEIKEYALESAAHHAKVYRRYNSHFGRHHAWIMQAWRRNHTDVLPRHIHTLLSVHHHSAVHEKEAAIVKQEEERSVAQADSPILEVAAVPENNVSTLLLTRPQVEVDHRHLGFYDAIKGKFSMFPQVVEKTMVTRTAYMGSFVISTGSASGSNPANYFMPYDLINASPVLQKTLAGFHLFRCTSSLRLQATAPPFTTGSLLIAITLGAAYMGPTNVYQASQSHCVRWEIGSGKDLVLRLPYFWHQPWLQCDLLSADTITNGAVSIWVASPISTGVTSGNANITIQAYAQVDDIEVDSYYPNEILPLPGALRRAIPATHRAATTLASAHHHSAANSARSNKESKKKTTNVNTPPVERPLGLQIVDTILGAPGALIGGILKPINDSGGGEGLGGLFSALGKLAPLAGFFLDKPIRVDAPTPTFPAITTTAHTRGLSNAVSLDTAQARLAVPFAHDGADIKQLIRIPSLIKMFQVTSASPTDTNVWTQSLNIARLCNATRTGAGPTYTYTFNHSPLSYFSRFYGQWRGSITFDIYASCAGTTRGLVLIWFQPTDETLLANPSQYIGDLPNLQFEINGPSHCQIEVPCSTDLFSPAVPPYVTTTLFGAGTLNMSVLVPFTTGDASTATCNFEVYVRAGSNFEYYGWKGATNINVSNSGPIPIVAGVRHHSLLSSPARPTSLSHASRMMTTENLNLVPAETHIPSLLKRHQYLTSIVSVTDTPVANALWACPAHQALISCFTGWIGSLEVGLMSTGGNNSAYVGRYNTLTNPTPGLAQMMDSGGAGMYLNELQPLTLHVPYWHTDLYSLIGDTNGGAFYDALNIHTYYATPTVVTMSAGDDYALVSFRYVPTEVVVSSNTLARPPQGQASPASNTNTPSPPPQPSKVAQSFY